MATGSVEVAGTRLEAGDALGIRGAGSIVIRGSEETEVVLWDLAGVR